MKAQASPSWGGACSCLPSEGEKALDPSAHLVIVVIQVGILTLQLHHLHLDDPVLLLVSHEPSIGVCLWGPGLLGGDASGKKPHPSVIPYRYKPTSPSPSLATPCPWTRQVGYLGKMAKGNWEAGEA